MNKEQEQKCKEVLDNLHEMWVNNSQKDLCESKVMEFGDSSEDYCNRANDLILRIREQQLEIRERQLIEAEADYLEQFGNDAWGEE